MEKVAVVIPIYKKTISKEESMSLNRCLRVLGSHPIIIVCPESLIKDLWLEKLIPKFFKKNIEFASFDNYFFKSTVSYNYLMKSRSFYETFNDYRYILVYQLDAFVFRDELHRWCDKEYDYIGAPWIYDDFIDSYQGIHVPFWQFGRWRRSKNYGGNGGFSLRKVSSHLRVLKHFKKFAKKSTVNEDGFWSLEVPNLYPLFKVAPKEEALRFSFERYPEKLLELNGGNLPFGCHGWPKYNRDFWRKYILSDS